MGEPIYEYVDSMDALWALPESRPLAPKKDEIVPISTPAEVEATDQAKNIGRVAKLKAKLQAQWDKPNIRQGVGAAAYGAAILLIAGAATTLILHFTKGEIFGMKIPITYPVMLASFSSLAVLKGLQFREEATLIRQQEKLGATAPNNSLTDSKHEKIWKVVALIGGLAMIGLFSYDMVRLFQQSGLKVHAVTLVSAIGVLSYSLSLVQLFLANRRRNAKTAETKAENIEKRGKLKERLIRLAPSRLGKIAAVGGGVIILTALAGLIARYGFDVKGIAIGSSYTPLSLSNILSLGAMGAMVSLGGALGVAFGSKEEKMVEQDEKIATLREELKKLDKLAGNKLEERKATIKKAIGTLAIVTGLVLFAMQLWGFDAASFRRVFGTTIKTDLLSFTAVLTTAFGVTGGGIRLINNAVEHRRDIEEADLKLALEKARHKKEE